MEKPPILFALPADAPIARCLDCGYVIEGLPEPVCPECGRPFDSRNPASFTTKPPLRRWRLWFPGLLTAFTVGMLTTIYMLSINSTGWAVWFAPSAAAGCILGYRVQSRWYFFTALVILLAAAIPMALATMHILGAFCGAVLVGIAIGPMTIGVVVGTVVRLILKATKFSQGAHLPVLAVFTITPLAFYHAVPPVRHAPEIVRTARTIAAPTAIVFDRLVFYEEVQHEPPWLLRLALPKPQGATGRMDRVGEIRRCLYDTGHITKQVTEVQRPKRIAFTVIEQNIHFERDVALRGGDFTLTPLGPDHTQLSLTTEYEPLLSPRWLWRPMETVVIRTLHDHVLEGVARECPIDAPARLAEATP